MSKETQLHGEVQCSLFSKQLCVPSSQCQRTGLKRCRAMNNCGLPPPQAYQRPRAPTQRVRSVQKKNKKNHTKQNTQTHKLVSSLWHPKALVLPGQESEVPHLEKRPGQACKVHKASHPLKGRASSLQQEDPGRHHYLWRADSRLAGGN